MNSRTRTLWLPGLITLAASAIVLMIIGRVDIQPRVIWLRTDSLAFVFYVPWLVTLPLFGAAGAYLSRRAQGQFLARITAGLFPSAVMLAAMCLILPLGLIIDRHVLLSLKLSGFAVGVFNWVVVPGAALLLGALPFLGKPHVVGNR